MSAKHFTMKVGIYVIVRCLADIYPTCVRHLSRDICPPYIILRFSAQDEKDVRSGRGREEVDLRDAKLIKIMEG